MKSFKSKSHLLNNYTDRRSYSDMTENGSYSSPNVPTHVVRDHNLNHAYQSTLSNPHNVENNIHQPIRNTSANIPCPNKLPEMISPKSLKNTTAAKSRASARWTHLSETIKPKEATSRSDLSPTSAATRERWLALIKKQKQDENAPKTKIERIVRDFSNKTNLHGIYEIYHAGHRLSATFWQLAFTIAFGVVVYECYNIIQGYIKSPVMVSYLVAEARDGLQLPDLYICPFNRLDEQYLRSNNVSLELQLYIELGFHDKVQEYTSLYYMGDPPDYLLDQSRWGEFEEQLRLLLKRLDLNYTEFIDEASMPCESMVQQCPTGDLPQDCCAAVEDYQTSFGKCFRFKKEDEKNNKQIGNGIGFGERYFFHQPSTGNESRYSTTLSNFQNDGFWLMLADPNRGPDYDISFLPIGVHAILSLRATHFKFINDPPRFTCSAESYARQTCFDECFEGLFEEECNCSRPGTKNPKHRLCRTVDLECRMHVEKNHIQTYENIKKIIGDCRQACKTNCNYWQYTKTLSFSNFPAKRFRAHNRTKPWEFYEQSTILDMFYENLEHTVIEHHPSMTVDMFIANLGGQIGLWVGGSILTSIQVLVFLVQLGYTAIFQRSTNANPPIENADTCAFEQENHADKEMERLKKPKSSKKHFVDTQLASRNCKYVHKIGSNKPVHNMNDANDVIWSKADTGSEMAYPDHNENYGSNRRPDANTLSSREHPHNPQHLNNCHSFHVIFCSHCDNAYMLSHCRVVPLSPTHSNTTNRPANNINCQNVPENHPFSDTSLACNGNQPNGHLHNGPMAPVDSAATLDTTIGSIPCPKIPPFSPQKFIEESLI